MLVISPDFRVCWQIIKVKPEEFEAQKWDLRRRTSRGIEKLHMPAKNVLLI